MQNTFENEHFPQLEVERRIFDVLTHRCVPPLNIVTFSPWTMRGSTNQERSYCSTLRVERNKKYGEIEVHFVKNELRSQLVFNDLIFEQISGNVDFNKLSIPDLWLNIKLPNQMATVRVLDS